MTQLGHRSHMDTIRTSADMDQNIEIPYFKLSEGRDSPEGDPSQLGRSASHVQHLSTCCYTIPDLLLASLPAS